MDYAHRRPIIDQVNFCSTNSLLTTLRKTVRTDITKFSQAAERRPNNKNFKTINILVLNDDGDNNDEAGWDEDEYFGSF